MARNPDLKFSPVTGAAVAVFSIAVDRPKKKGEDSVVDFFECVAFQQTGENIARYLAKGARVGVVGSMTIETYTGKDGIKRKSPKLIVESFDIIGGKKEQNSNASESRNDFSSKDANKELEPAYLDDTDIPF